GARSAGPAAGQHGIDPGDEVERVEGLGDVVLDAELHAPLDVAALGPGGHEDDGDGGRLGILAQSPGHLVAGHAGHHHVEYENIREDGPGLFEALDSVGG